jgi:phosphonate transport system substrate-binding protein
MKIKTTFCLLALTALAACSSPTPEPTALQPTATASPAAEKKIVFGDISDDPTEVIDGTQPIADYVASHLGEFGITSGEVKVVSSTDEMIQMLKDGEVDLYFDSTYPATLISDASGAHIILRRWRFGVESYHSVIYASKASGITSIEELKGKLVAMDAPYSTSGFVLPAVYMTEHGLKLAGKKDKSDPINNDEVGFAFAYDDENVLQWVLSGAAPAGVTDNYNFDTAFPKDATQNLVELGRTESVPRQVVVASSGLDPAMLEAILQVLTNMDKDPDAKGVLDTFQTTKFDAFPEGSDAALSRMREMMEIIKAIPLP